MEPRLIIAYSMMLVWTLLLASFVAYRTYHARDRSYRRRVRKKYRIYEDRRAPPGLRACGRQPVSVYPGSPEAAFPSRLAWASASLSLV